MHDIVGIGASLYDTLMVVSQYPREDTKMLADRSMGQGGGPCATALAAASRLGAGTAYIGTVGDDVAGSFMLKDFKRHGVDTEYISVRSGYLSYMSFILLNDETGSRTVIWNKGNIPPLELGEKEMQAIRGAKVLHLDGNHLDAAIVGATVAKKAGVKVSMDAGGVYQGVEKILPYVDYLIPSEEFAINYTGASSAEQAAKQLYLEFHPEVLILTQGNRGGFLYDGNLHRYPSFKVRVLDSNGAGDVFHGAFLTSYISGNSIMDSAVFASAASAIKCSRLGGRMSVPGKEEVIDFLKKNTKQQGGKH